MFQMSYTPQSSPGTVYPNSIWVAKQFTIDPSTGMGILLYLAWASSADYASNLPPLPFPDAIHRYNFIEGNGPFALVSGSITPAQIPSILDSYASSVKDTNGISFFATAAQQAQI